jgi:pimeloyl-ACP methyl ester carboxylesterase
MTEPTIRRAFADLPHGQLHFRTGGEGETLLMLHASPGSSRQLAKMITAFSSTMRVVAPDTPGNGDSEPLPGDRLEITDLAQALLAFLDSQTIERMHIYGTHTGAAIAAELAILAPDRICTIMLDGISDFQGEELGDYLAQYAKPFEADLDGAYLSRIFQFCRDQYQFFPWFRRTRAARRDGGLPHADDLAALVIEVLKARTSYQRNYQAAFRWPARERLALVPCPALLMASAADPLHDTTQSLAQFTASRQFQSLPRFDAPDFATAMQATMQQFMNSES